MDYIRNLIDSLISELSNNDEYEHILKDYEYIIYYDIIDIISNLKLSNDLYQKKNIFGQYTNDVMKKLDHIRSSYEKGNVYLSEASIILKRNTKYEIPSLEKQIYKLEKQILDIEKKKIEYQKNIELLLKNYRNDCSKYGLTDHDDFKNDESFYFESLKNNNSKLLNDMIHEIEILCKSETIKKCIDVYLRFQGSREDLKTLNEIIEKDEEASTVINDNDDYQMIDHYEDIHKYTFEIVDQGFDSLNNDEFTYNISSDQSNIYSMDDNHLSSSSLDDHNSLSKYLYDYSFRNHLLNNLFLLFYFFKQRIADIEVSSKQKLSFLNDIHMGQNESIGDLSNYKSFINEIIQKLTSNDLQERLLMNSSKSYIERIIKSIKSKIDQINYYKNQIEMMNKRRIDIKNKINESKEKLNQIIKRKDFIRKRTEEKISSLYDGRKTFIK